MKPSKIVFGLLTVILAMSAALVNAKTQRVNTYWYKNWIFFCSAIEVEFTCIPDAFGGCIGPNGSQAEDEQLYLTSGCETKLKKE